MVALFTFLISLVFFSVAQASREAQDEEFPFQVSIKTVDNRHLCGGAIITSKWILTASDCFQLNMGVLVSLGTADSNNPIRTIPSQRIVHEIQNDPNKKNSLALVELKEHIEFSHTMKAAKLPTEKSQLRNTTKLSGWDVSNTVNIPPVLHATDKYYVIKENCKTSSGIPIPLNVDNFCGEDENHNNEITSLGSIVSKKSIVLGLIAQKPLPHISPIIFVQISKHEQWIREALGEDAQYVSWVDTIPKDSAPSQYGKSLLLVGLSLIFLRYL